MADITHTDGVAWNQAALPPRQHRCEAQTTTHSAEGIMQRCACGGARFLSFLSLYDGQAYTPRWVQRNSRRSDPDHYRRPWWVRALRSLL